MVDPVELHELTKSFGNALDNVGAFVPDKDIGDFLGVDPRTIRNWKSAGGGTPKLESVLLVASRAIGVLVEGFATPRWFDTVPQFTSHYEQMLSDSKDILCVVNSGREFLSANAVRKALGRQEPPNVRAVFRHSENPARIERGQWRAGSQSGDYLKQLQDLTQANARLVPDGCRRFHRHFPLITNLFGIDGRCFLAPISQTEPGHLGVGEVPTKLCPTILALMEWLWRTAEDTDPKVE